MNDRLLSAIIIFACISGCSRSNYVEAPIDSCKSQYTGRSSSQTEQTGQICASYDSNMNCSIQVPIYDDVTYREVRTICDFVEMKR